MIALADEISIMITAKDNFTDAVKKMRDYNTLFTKDIGDLQKKLDGLSSRKVSINLDFNNAKEELKKAKKAFSETKSEAEKLRLEAAQANYDNIQRNLKLLSREAKETEQAILGAEKGISKLQNRAESGGNILSGKGTQSRSEGSGILSQLGSAGAAQMAGDMLSNLANSYIGSAYGSEAGTMFSSVLSSAGAGAAIGTAIAPGIGTAIGTAAGMIIGAINGSVENFENKDSIFKGVVQDSYENVKQSESDTLVSGSEIAANREITEQSFVTLFRDDAIAKDYLNDMQIMANTTPFKFDELTAISKTLRAYGFESGEGMLDMQGVIRTIGDAGSALGLGVSDINEIATALGRMRSSGKVSLEDLDMLQDRGINAIDILSKTYGLSQKDVYSGISDNRFKGEDVVEELIAALNGNREENGLQGYAGSMEAQSNTFAGKTSTLEGLQDNMSAAMGEGYNWIRMEGLQEQIDYLSGESGQKMEEANRLIGAWKADLDNQHDEAIRNAMNSMMESEEYKAAQESNDLVEMGRLMALAQIQGENDFKESEGYQMQLEADKSLISSIREDTALKEEYWNTGQVMGTEFTKGMKASVSDEMRIILGPTGSLGFSLGSDSDTTESKQLTKEERESFAREEFAVNWDKKFAVGLNYVPYDNYPALLHQGERVLTASEARSANTTPNINITGNQFTVREDADIDKIAAAIVQQIRMARMVSAQ